MILLSISIFWLSVCVDPFSADPHITVEAHVGSTALLPCHLSKDFTQTSVIQWRADNEIVFERSFDDTHEGPGYEGRVDVPEDELHKGNCSLVLKDVRITDHAFYRSLELAESKYFYKATEINTVQLDVVQSVSAQVGSTAVLPCDWRHLSIQTPHVEWSIGDEIVFERLGKDSFQGEGYEGRVDVPEEELLKGNCSLVLKNVSVTDEARYSSYILMTDTKKPALVQNIKLSASEKFEKREDDPLGTINSWVVIFILPINSALNPILYTLTTSFFREQVELLLCRWQRSSSFMKDRKSLTSTTIYMEPSRHMFYHSKGKLSQVSYPDARYS
ncbi:relaxin/insulin-like family peptide receptor 2a [Silurus asotus]|uniref:Relaxin/insulin-like family peptide receptor 2a n=1 Tax=Silurus asotus TaxID=30991 RepID=A0AAD5AC73_SILAS|nr:relaxin/insulin-like family peptide receptor 2a [Silurus asotus]